MERKAISRIMLTLLLISMLTLACINWVRSDYVIKLGLGVYWDFNCTNLISYIDWEVLTPGENRNLTVYIKNEGDVNATQIYFVSDNWIPPESAYYIHISWDYSGELLEPDQVASVTLTLSVAPNIEGIEAFGFDILIGASWNGIGYHMRIATVGSVVYYSDIVVNATIEIDSDTLNLKSKGKWVTSYIELPEDYNLNDIDISTVKLNDIVQAELYPSEIGDYEEDGIPDLMVKFNRQDLIAILSAGEATLKVTGEVNGVPFEASDTIKVIDE